MAAPLVVEMVVEASETETEVTGAMGALKTAGRKNRAVAAERSVEPSIAKRTIRVGSKRVKGFGFW